MNNDKNNVGSEILKVSKRIADISRKSDNYRIVGINEFNILKEIFPNDFKTTD